MHVKHFVENPPCRNASGKIDIKIAYIGGGSRQWAHNLMRDLALSEYLGGSLHLYDLNFDAALYNEELGGQLFGLEQARAKFRVVAERELKGALTGADFVVMSIEPGPVTMRHADLEIPASYGVLQTVGDTTGPGGILRALRSVPIYESLAHAVMEYCPNAWVINYTNPMAVCTGSLFAAEPNIKAFGCCHEVFNTQKMLAELVEQHFEVPRPDRSEIQLDISGVNHFTWAISATWDGHDLLPILRERIAQKDFFRSRTAEALELKKTESWFKHSSLIAHDLFRRFGALGAAGDRHLAEFVPWYLTSEETLHRWGVVATPYAWRVKRDAAPRPTLADLNNTLQPSGEEGVRQMEALLGCGDYVTNINVRNIGQVRELEPGIIVETNAILSRDKIRPVCAGSLPTGAAEWVRRAAAEQALTLQAALQKDFGIARQAIMLDPLVRLDADQVDEMLLAMLAGTRELLPGWF